MSRKRLKPEIRKEEILLAAVVLAERDGYKCITRENVALKADCAQGSIAAYFGTMHSLKQSVLKYAIKNKNLKIIAQGFAHGDKLTRKVNKEVKKQALASL